VVRKVASKLQAVKDKVKRAEADRDNRAANKVGRKDDRAKVVSAAVKVKKGS